MKKIYKIILIPVLTLVFCTCDILNEPKPEGALPLDNLTTIENYRTFLNGVYNGPQNIAAQLLFMSDSMTEYVQWSLSFVQYGEIAGHAMAANNSAVESLWNQMYRSINEANIIIAKVNEVDSGTQAEKDDIKAQAHFLRAYMYTVLVHYFSKPWGATPDNSHLGVPLKLQPVLATSDFEDNLPRASVKDVYDQINDDLQAADGKIINTNPDRATNGTVTALKARVALIQERWGDAAALAGSVIDDYDYRLSADVADFFRKELGSESIYEIVNTPDDNPGGGNTSISTIYNENTRPGGFITQDYRNAIKDLISARMAADLTAANSTSQDDRVTKLLASNSDTPPASIDDYTHSNKYEDGLTTSDNVPVLRLPEMYLTRAEALVRDTQTINQDAIDLINELRSRSIKVVLTNGDDGDGSIIEYKAADFADYEELLDAILLERTVELSYEGFFRLDLQRNHKNVRGAAWDANNLVFPIPLSQTDVTGDVIQQNPGY